jgi:hypothetical protein
LKAKYEELQSRYRNANERKSRLVRKSLNRTQVVETVIVKDERVEAFKSRLKNLIEENHILCNSITSKGETIRKSLRRSSFVPQY